MSSLSANILRYRSEKGPTAKVVDEIQQRIAKLQTSGLVTQEAIAKLCIRMSEGCIDETEANRLLTLPTSEFVEYVEHIRTSEKAYFEKEEENDNLRSQINELTEKDIRKDALLKMQKMRTHSLLYIVGAVVIYLLYWFFIYRNHFVNVYLDFFIQAIYWVITCVLMNLINHGHIWLGVKSFFMPDSVLYKIVKEKS